MNEHGRAKGSSPVPGNPLVWANRCPVLRLELL